MILVDTDVLIAHLRGIPTARTWLHQAHATSPLAVSAVTIAELTGGMRSAERREVWNLLSIMQSVPVTEPISRTAGEFVRQYRRSHTGIGLPDYLIAATAAHAGAEIATLNVRHFPMFQELRPPFAVR
ncbi:type II toxin-antitoxin system VapC family toxin [Pseudactinotalea sp. Z1739]|uniref:type II toxin-antitoxin system VapC family toxin n=1 Tax=Pseudactinotalea sp. Z1739 TaxID=3413028 RepID=UPI003C7E66D9